jgi:hypothetical protein
MTERRDDDEIPITVDDSPPARQAPGAATRILGTDVVAAALDIASRADLERAPSSSRSFDPARTRVLDMKRLWPQVEVASAPPNDRRPEPSAAAAQRVSAPPDSPLEVPRGVPKGIRATLRDASPRRRAIVAMIPITALIWVARAATDPSARPVTRANVATQSPSSEHRAPNPTAPRVTSTPAPTPAAPPPVAAALPAPRVVEPSAPSPEPTSARKGAPPRTLERDAADAVARADYGSAVRVYQELAALHPERSVFRESARILAEKVAPPER